MKKYYIVLMVLINLLFFGCKPKNYINISGLALGTSYSITYYDSQKRNLEPAVDSILAGFEQSLSVYNPQSIISKVNNNEPVKVDDYFIAVFKRSQELSALTSGAFDISAAPLFSAWGFGFENKQHITPKLIDSLKQFVGMDKVALQGCTVLKQHPETSFSANAIAKGYSCDVVAQYLDDLGIHNYLVEIGGEMVLKGKNSRGKAWEIGIEKPVDGNFISGTSLQMILRVTGKGLATSGNYRNFYIEDGQKYAHTIDPATGYPTKNNLLSATVIANDCMTADALATAFMVMGVEKTKDFLKTHPEYEAYLIYDENGKMKEYATPAMQKREAKY